MTKTAFALAVALLLASCHRTPATLTVWGPPEAVAAFVAQAQATGGLKVDTRTADGQATATITAVAGGAPRITELSKDAIGRHLSMKYEGSSFSVRIP